MDLIKLRPTKHATPLSVNLQQYGCQHSVVTAFSTLGLCVLCRNLRLPPLNDVLEHFIVAVHGVTLENDSSFCRGTALQCRVESFSDLLVPWAASPLMRLHLSCSQHFYLCAGPSSAPKGAFILCLPCRMDCGVCTGHYFALFVLARFSFRVSGLIGNILFSLLNHPKIRFLHCALPCTSHGSGLFR